MATKTDRILSYLPGTFRRAPQQSALFALVNAFGSELLKAENSLAAVMQAHWVDHADRGAEVIADLAAIAALYGLKPRCPEPGTSAVAAEKLCTLPSVCEETVEEFRRHLKRYIRTFIDGTVTVQGVLRVAAEALGLEIADEYDAMQRWWQGGDNELVTQTADQTDAARMLLGDAALTVMGREARAAQVQGAVDLSAGVNLGAAARLRLQIDAQSPLEIDLVDGVADPSAVALHWIEVAINVACGGAVARHDGRFLTLSSLTTGAESRLALLPVADDAAEKLLGLPPQQYQGSTARPASIRGQRDLSANVDLSEERYLRLNIDNTTLAEIDCAGPLASNSTLEQIADAINHALPFAIAAHDGRFLRLTSPTSGAGSLISLQTPAGQDASARLFGAVNSPALGQDDQPARAASRRDLGRGVDLSERSMLQISVDGAAAVSINCAGQDAANTSLSEIAAAISALIPTLIARHDGHFLTLTSPTTGPASSLRFELGGPGDATNDIFGIAPRSFSGAAAVAAQMRSAKELRDNINLTAQYQLQLAVDGGEARIVNLRAAITDPTAVQLFDLVTAINTAVGAEVAAAVDHHLLLTSPNSGAAGSLVISPLYKTVRRRFVTRAPIVQEAGSAIFGVLSTQAWGTAALPAQVQGSTTLSRGVDLRTQRYLRLAIDGQPSKEIDCAGKRPHVTVLDEIVEKINAGLGMTVATHNGANLVLTSLTSGEQSKITLEAPQPEDALPVLFGVPAGAWHGEDGAKVLFKGTVDLSQGIDLPAGASIRLGVDGGEPIQIDLSAAGAAHKSLDALVIAINLAIGSTVASHDGAHLVLTSATTGAASQIVLAPAGDQDVTAALFGVTPPRSYHGRAAKPAEVIGQVTLGDEVDLSVRRFLRIGVNGATPIDVDCANATDAAHTQVSAVVDTINTTLGQTLATVEDGRLVLRTPITGSASQLTLAPYTSGDARVLLLGSVSAETVGKAPGPATLTGTVDLLAPVNLAERSLLRLAVDGGRPIDIDCAGAAPATTFGDEIVAAINQVLPGMALLTPESRLQLSSPTAGENSQLTLLPLRYLEMIEYPPQPTNLPPRLVRHGDKWSVDNSGAANVYAEIELQAAHGVVGPGLVNVTSGWQVRLLTTLTAGASARLWHDPAHGLQVTVRTPNGESYALPAEQIIVSPVGADSTDSPLFEAERSQVLHLPQGRSQWRYFDCYDSRFNYASFDKNYANFDKGRFAGEVCRDRGVFDISHFVQDRSAPLLAVFAATPLVDPTVAVIFHWTQHEAGAFQVNLPLDLPPRFGGRFNQAHFGLPADKPEVYNAAVTGPAEDERYLVDLIKGNEHSLLQADIVGSVDLGWSAAPMPMRRAQFLTLGDETRPARLYLTEAGIDGFLLLQAHSPGAWGNAIAVSTRQSGPGQYDVCILFQGDRFESARQIALGEPLPALTQELVRPNQVGVLQAKAAGVRAEVTRVATG